MPGAKARLRLDGADPINKGLVGFWPLRDNAGLIAANLTRQPGTNGALTNSPTWTARGLNLAGTNQYVTVADNAAFDLSGGQSTVSLWIRGTYASQVNYGALIAKGTGSNNWGLYRDFNTTSLNILTQNDTQLANFPGAYGAIMDGNLRHVVWVQSGGSARLYIDGVLNNTQALASPNNTSSPVYLGAGWSGVVPHVGQISNYRVFKRALTPTEVTRLYRDPWAGTARARQRAYSATLSPRTATIAGTVSITGSLTTTLADRATISGTVGITGSVAATLADNATIAGTVPITGSITTQLDRLASIAGTVDITGAITVDTGASTGDTHDGMVRRSRRQRAIDAAEKRRRDELAAEAVALRLSLEAAMGEAAEAVEEAPEPIAERVEQATKEAARYVPRLVAGPSPEVMEAANKAVVALRAAVAAADRARMLAEDDEEVMMLLRAL